MKNRLIAAKKRRMKDHPTPLYPDNSPGNVFALGLLGGFVLSFLIAHFAPFLIR